MTDRTLKPLSKKKWSGGGENLFTNVELAVERHADKFSQSGLPIVFKNVIPFRLMITGRFVYIPQNAWPWHGSASSIAEIFRRSSLRFLSEMARLRAQKIVRIGPMIPNSRNCEPGFLPNALDEVFEKELEKSKYDKKPDWIPSSPYFIVPGSYWSYRNLEFVIESYITYLATAPSSSISKLLIVGPATQKRYFERIESQCAPYPNIITIGAQVPRSELMAALRSSQMCIFSSQVEASPVTVLEAAALHVPSIAFDIEAFRYIETHLAGGRLCFFRKQEELTHYMHHPVNFTQSELNKKEYRENARNDWTDQLVQKCLS